jgi:hypothetical protein
MDPSLFHLPTCPQVLMIMGTSTGPMVNQELLLVPFTLLDMFPSCRNAAGASPSASGADHNKE